MSSQLEELNRHIEELAGRLPVGNRDRLLEDAMAVRAIIVGANSQHHIELSAAFGMAIRKQQEIERLRARLAEAERDAKAHYLSGYTQGHHDTVEGLYSPELRTEEYVDELVADAARAGDTGEKP